MERIGILSTLDDTELKALIDCGETLNIAAGTHVIEHGQHNDSLFIVREGLLHAYRKGARKRVLLARLDPGAAFGEISLFDPGVTTATIEAVSDSRVLRVHQDALARLSTTCPSAALKLLQQLLVQMAGRLRNVDMRLVDSINWGGGER